MQTCMSRLFLTNTGAETRETNADWLLLEQRLFLDKMRVTMIHSWPATLWHEKFERVKLHIAWCSPYQSVMIWCMHRFLVILFSIYPINHAIKSFVRRNTAWPNPQVCQRLTSGSWAHFNTQKDDYQQLYCTVSIIILFIFLLIQCMHLKAMYFQTEHLLPPTRCHVMHDIITGLSAHQKLVFTCVCTYLQFTA